MEGETKREVNGFLFDTPNEAQKAELELKKIQYLESRIDYADIRKVQAIYEKAVNDHFFHTAVGLFYLKGIRDFLVREDERYEGVLPYVPIEPVKETAREAEGAGEKEKEGKNAAGAKTKTAQLKREEKEKKRQQEQKAKFQISVLINVFLAVAVIVMFWIALKSEQPNILNYEKAIKNRYATWEQELTEREKKLRERELEIFRETDGGTANGEY